MRHAIRHDADPPSLAQGLRTANTSHALTDARLYRPGALLAACVLLSPPMLALIGAGLSLHVLGRIPVWLPLTLLLWLPLLPVAWLTMISVRTSPTGLAIARPWQRWNEIRWAHIEQVQRSGPRIVVHSSDGRSARFYPLTLRDGARLKRELLMRLPMHVLDARLRGSARELLGEPIGQRAQSLIAGPVEVRPHPSWGLALVAVQLGAAGGAWIAAVSLPLALGIVAIVLALGIIGLCAAALPLVLQRIALTDAGVAVIGFLGRQVGRADWTEIQLIERTAHEHVLRMRGVRRLRCPGPALLSASDGEIFRAYLQTYCFDRGAFVIVRRWL